MDIKEFVVCPACYCAQPAAPVLVVSVLPPLISLKLCFVSSSCGCSSVRGWGASAICMFYKGCFLWAREGRSTETTCTRATRVCDHVEHHPWRCPPQSGWQASGQVVVQVSRMDLALFPSPGWAEARGLLGLSCPVLALPRPAPLQVGGHCMARWVPWDQGDVKATGSAPRFQAVLFMTKS